MLCGCSKLGKKSPPKSSTSIALREADNDADSTYGLIIPDDVPQSPGAIVSDSWCPVLGPDHHSYPRGQYHHGNKPKPNHHHDNTYAKGHHHDDKCPMSMYQNPGFDSGIDTGSSPDSGHSQSRSGQTVKILDPYGSTPVLEVSQRGSTSTLNGRPTRMLQTYRGQMKLAVYFNSGLLTLHVKQAKHLTSKWSAMPCPYVKVAIIPDDKSRCKTELQTDTDRPKFDEKFSFEIGDEDFHKRIYVGVYSKDPNHNRGELLGCMSFGIHNIVRGKTSVHGWYFLLSEHIGKRKHLQAHNRRHLVVDPDDYACVLSETTSCSEFSTVHEDIAPLSSVLRMSRGSDGYGFTLTGGCPSQVFTVEIDSPADMAGMRVGDSVLSINGQDVSRATVNTIARILRFHQEVYVEVQCTSAPTPPAWRGTCSTPLKQPPPPPHPPVKASLLKHLNSQGTTTQPRNNSTHTRFNSHAQAQYRGGHSSSDNSQAVSMRYS